MTMRSSTQLPEPGSPPAPVEPRQALRVLLADDHALFRAGLRCILARFHPGLALDEASSFRQAIAAVTTHPYDLVLMDLMMPDMEPLDGLRALRAAAPQIPVAVLSMLDSEADVQRALAAGVAGFIPKASTSTITCHAIALILSGGVYLPQGGPGLPPRTAEEGNGNAGSKSIDRLPHRQQEVLRELLRGKSTREIAHALDAGESVVKNDILALKRFFKVNNRVRLIMAAAGQLDPLPMRPPASPPPDRSGPSPRSDVTDPNPDRRAVAVAGDRFTVSSAAQREPAEPG